MRAYRCWLQDTAALKDIMVSHFTTSCSIISIFILLYRQSFNTTKHMSATFHKATFNIVQVSGDSLAYVLALFPILITMKHDAP
jgi:hypothetical protein